MGNYACPFCERSFEDDRPETPVNELGQELRDHLQTDHAVQDHDLKTTRWVDGAFVRTEPWLPQRRILRQQRRPPTGHALERFEQVDGEPGATESVLVFCGCGWRGLSLHGTEQAWHILRVHFRSAASVRTADGPLRTRIARLSSVRWQATSGPNIPTSFRGVTANARRDRRRPVDARRAMPKGTLGRTAG